MKNILLLDCTLRDGGYVNNFTFGYSAIKRIISKLEQASVDIIECGFLCAGADDIDKTLFSSVNEIDTLIDKKNSYVMYVAMLQYGKLEIENILDCSQTKVDGIRLTFHKSEIKPALALAVQIMNKGYKVFIQPIATSLYEDLELLELIENVNKIHPYAFYIVDTLGSLFLTDLPGVGMLKLIDKNLDKDIALGFHAHNNLQMAFANAQTLVNYKSDRKFIIDASVLGMGRGAGNLCTELIAKFINDRVGYQYDIIQLLEVIDEYIYPLSNKYKWGYGINYYLSSITNSHPNYATFLMNKQTTYVRDVNSILNSLEENRRSEFDESYISEEYLSYMTNMINDEMSCDKIRTLLTDTILLLGPGRSANIDREKILSFLNDEDCSVISVNYIPNILPVKLAFYSNKKRIEKTKKTLIKSLDNLIITSNIKDVREDNVLLINYSSYLVDEESICDNSLLMCINLLIKLGVKKIFLAGFDGYAYTAENNYYSKDLILNSDTEYLHLVNTKIKQKINQLRKRIIINFLTESIYQEK